VADRSDDEQFKAFHKMLCERFDYGHDDKDWKRDQVSLMEHIASQIGKAPPLGLEDWVGSDLEHTGHFEVMRAYNGVLVRPSYRGIDRATVASSDQLLVFQDVDKFFDWFQQWHKATVAK
jgi:hypothetical protein